MADFNPPWANSGERREPTSDEQNGGFLCGPADQALFNWLNWAPQSEINKVIVEAGLTPSNGDMTQLYQAIQALISAATGGGDTSNFVLMTQARARLPIFPEVQNAQFHFGVTSPGTGQIRIPAGVVFQHRGIFPVTTVQTDFATDPSKTYHLRWNPTDGFSVKDLAAPAYNPTVAPEISTIFDTTYDDMLCARIITNSSNVPTITNLLNKDRLFAEGDTTQLPQGGIVTFDDNLAPSQIPGSGGQTIALNWSRKPHAYLVGFTDVTVDTGVNQSAEMNVVVQSLSRYQIRCAYQRTVSPAGGWIGYSAHA